MTFSLFDEKEVSFSDLILTIKSLSDISYKKSVIYNEYNGIWYIFWMNNDNDYQNTVLSYRAKIHKENKHWWAHLKLCISLSTKNSNNL